MQRSHRRHEHRLHTGGCLRLEAGLCVPYRLFCETSLWLAAFIVQHNNLPGLGGKPDNPFAHFQWTHTHILQAIKLNLPFRQHVIRLVVGLCRFFPFVCLSLCSDIRTLLLLRSETHEMNTQTHLDCINCCFSETKLWSVVSDGSADQRFHRGICWGNEWHQQEG